MSMIVGGLRMRAPHKLWAEQGRAAVAQVLSQQRVTSVPYEQWNHKREFSQTLASTVHQGVLGRDVVTEQHEVIGRCLQAKEAIEANTLVIPVDGIVLHERNTWTIQISETEHLLSVGGAQLAQHSCTPNMQLVFDYTALKVYPGCEKPLPSLYFASKHRIAKGERLSFDYNTSEWVIADTFVDDATGRHISGFSKVTDPVYRLRLLPFVTPPVAEACVKAGLLSPEEQQIAGIRASAI